MTRVELYDYDLPQELIAVRPSERREESRLLVLDRWRGIRKHRQFRDLPEFLREGDVLVLNDARVLPARLQASRLTGGTVEVLLERAVDSGGNPERHWLGMARARGTLKVGEMLPLAGTGLHMTLVDRREDGDWVLCLGDRKSEEAILATGSVPLPPYIIKARRRQGLAGQMPDLDRERYQTVYAARDGAVAAPTAGLHFTQRLLDSIRGYGVETHMLSLLVGPGTFQPVRAKHLEKHRLRPEFFDLPGPTARAVAEALAGNRRVIAVGTTTCRVLEHVARHGEWEEQSGWTDAYIYPPYTFRAISGLVTNFHLPRSTLLMLVSALAGRENVLRAYAEAVERSYRFYSYGDAMFIA